MVKKIKRFDDGGYTGDDPIIKYRMGITDEYKNNAPYKSDNQGATPALKENPTFETAIGDNPMISLATRKKALYQKAPRYISKDTNYKSITPDRLVRKDILDQFPRDNKNKFNELVDKKNSEYEDAGYKKGGKVKTKSPSASKRADGIAQRGKTKGKYL